MKYEIKGGSLPVVIFNLQAGESIVTEGGGMAWMSSNMHMETTTNGGIGKAIGRMFSGEDIFQNIYTSRDSEGFIAVASSFPGSIRAVEISPGNEVIVQKSAFLAAEKGVELSVHLRKKISASFFGGEGLIMQRLSGNGTAFIEIDGFAVEYDLKPGESIVADTGRVAMMSATCTMEVNFVKGVKNMIFGGEGMFNTVVTGPGKVIVQTMPITAVAGVLEPFFRGSINN